VRRGSRPGDSGRILGRGILVAIVRWANQALDALFAPDCAACRQRLGSDRDGPVCGRCWGAVRLVSPPWCDICGEPRMSWRTPSEGPACARCVDNPPDFDQARAYGLYEGTLRQIVRALKYQGHQSLGAHLGALMRQGDGGLLSRADAVVPVPLHPWRRLRRGFNQADELARHLGLPVWRALGRRSRGRPQAGLSAEHRRANVEDAYGLSLDWSGLLRRRRPSHVVLIDDVMTTGATLDACSRVLRDAGVEWIGALTAARAASPTAGPGGPIPRLLSPPAHRLSPPRRR
jgi:ComF family protein